jgi:hypothetical protein
MEQERIVPGSYRPVDPARAVWVSTDGTHYRDGLLLAWRKQFLPSKGDPHAHWFGLVLFARTHGHDIAQEAKWTWEPYILPVPNDAVVREMAHEQRRGRRELSGPGTHEAARPSRS